MTAITLDKPQLFYIKKPFYDVEFIMDRRRDIIIKHYDLKDRPFVSKSDIEKEVKRLTIEKQNSMFL